MPEQQLKLIALSETRGIDVIQFREVRMVDDGTIQLLGEELKQAISGKPGIKLVVDLTAIEQMGSAALGKLITLSRRVQQAQGRLVLCGLSLELQEIFQIARLKDYFMVFDTQEQATGSLLAIG